MNALTEYIHSKGMKAGIYTSPGPLTCGGYTGAFKHEATDAKTFADWGFDLLKYDWCSYSTGKQRTLAESKKPYSLMGSLLKEQHRDILFNLCQYGMDKVWTWGEEVGGHSWRTAGDLGGSFEDIPAGMISIGFGQNGLESHAAPGAWNDPDYLLLGYLSKWNGNTALTPLTPNEQYTHVSLWCMLAAPLIFSGDMTRLDKFTLSLLTNDEVIAIDQDSLGKQGYCVKKDGDIQVWMKELENGSKAVGLFNLGKETKKISANWSDLKIQGTQTVRDLWRQKDLGEFSDKYEASIYPHGVVLVRIFKGK